MRRGHNGLLALVGEELKEEIRSGALFCSPTKSPRLLKVLHFDGTGLWLLTKRLEKGTLLAASRGVRILTDGIDMHGATLRGW